MAAVRVVKTIGMATNSPSWRVFAPGETSDGSDEFENGSSAAESGAGRSEKRRTLRRGSSTICNASESCAATEIDGSECDRGRKESEFGVGYDGAEVECERSGGKASESEKRSAKRGTESGKSRNSKKGNSIGDECGIKKCTETESRRKSDGKNKWGEISLVHDSATVGGDGERNGEERSGCRQHELNPSSNEINRTDVIASRDLTSNSAIESDQNKCEKNNCPGKRTSSCSNLKSTCSEGSYSRRKHHHKHHKHKQKSKSPTRQEDVPSVVPKVNPIFLWVRQEDTRIVEVLCEDYDHRNRLRLTRTHLGWRAIPKTKRFAEAIIPKAEMASAAKENDREEASQRRNSKKKRSSKRKKSSDATDATVRTGNPTKIKQCSVALYRDDSVDYKNKNKEASDEDRSEKMCDDDIPDARSTLKSTLGETSATELHPGVNRSRSLPGEQVDASCVTSNVSTRLTKSSSCDFKTLKKALSGDLPRSISLDLNAKRDDCESMVQRERVRMKSLVRPNAEDVVRVKSEPETGREEVGEVECDPGIGNIAVKEVEDLISQRNDTGSIVMDMTKHDSDFNDADCDELGQLLKDIPDLEFVEEEELEEVDEDEDWSTPTDLTLPKSKTESETSIVKLPLLPHNISPLVTVTSSVRPVEPLTAPLPEVTITPVPPNPKPAHQQKPQNNFLESLLSSAHSIKPEKDGVRHLIERRSLEVSPCERKPSKHFREVESEFETKSKKLKVEDITLKSLLSKNNVGKRSKPLDLETREQNSKMSDGESDCSKSRLQELLTTGAGAGKADPISQLKEVLSNPHLAVPDPLLVPRARLPALVASPASEIPRLLTMHLEKTIEETRRPPITDSDVLEVSLSNLRSLLSRGPEKVKTAGAQDLAYYQKSLETFLEWQRYQTELLEAQMKSSNTLSSGFGAGEMSDVATATAFGQMLWLPYLNQFDFNCGAGRDVASLMSTPAVGDYQTDSSKLTAPPQINTSQVPQPSPFLTPTSPMDVESQLKTLAMWQEAVLLQQNSQVPRACAKAPLTKSPTHQDSRRSVKLSGSARGTSPKKQMSSQRASFPCRGDPVQKSHSAFEIYQDAQGEHQKKQSGGRQSNYQQRLEDQQKQMELKYKQEQQNQFRKMQRNYANYQNEYLRQCKMRERKISGQVPGSRSTSNHFDKTGFSCESKISWEKLEEESKKGRGDLSSPLKVKEENEWTDQKEKKSSSPDQKLNPGDVKDAPKLKVKNLVDPNMSPPKLLKQIAPEHLPMVMGETGSMQDDSHTHLWHPLFGSNQIKPQTYNSPWSWTTVTVNGE